VILALSGSLKQRSLNSAALRAAASAAARDGIVIRVDDSVRRLPHFDPDLEASPPEIVLRFRRACETAAGLLLAVPEYAFGIPGAFKNALDWTVGSGSLYRKPIAVLSVAPPGRGGHVREALSAVLTALDADVTRHAVPVADRDLDANGELGDPLLRDALGAVVAELALRAGEARAASATRV
jgi:chromate reductase, NAD(P)H dehydrogenase (quinone)